MLTLDCRLAFVPAVKRILGCVSITGRPEAVSRSARNRTTNRKKRASPHGIPPSGDRSWIGLSGWRGKEVGATPPNVERETGEKREWFPTIGAPIPTTSSLWVQLWQYLIKGVTDGVVGLDSLLAMIFAEPETALFICRKLYRWFVYYVVDPACGTGGFFLAGKGLSRSFPGTMIFPLMGGERWRSVLVLRCLQRGFDR